VLGKTRKEQPMMYDYPSRPISGLPQYTARPHAGATALLFMPVAYPAPSTLPVHAFVQNVAIRAIATFFIFSNHNHQPSRATMKTLYKHPPGAVHFGHAPSPGHPSWW
jgi:hypothetical protein